MYAEADAFARICSYAITFLNSGLESYPPTGPSTQFQLIPANLVDISTLTQNPNQVLDGKYFLCRTIAPSYRICAVEAIVEDPKGQQGICLSLNNYSFLDQCNFEGLLEELPVAQILAIKNPCFKSQQTGQLILKCNNPEDVVFISESMSQELFPEVKWESKISEKWKQFIQSTPKTSTEWKNQGNKEFLRQKYENAIQSYTEGLNLNSGTGTGTDAADLAMCAILSYRAAAYLKLDCFQSALDDVEKSLVMDPTHFKGLYLRGKALLGLQRVQEAVQLLEQLLNLGNLTSDNKKLLTELMESALNFLRQKNSGRYNILELYQAGRIRHNDCADFMGPVKIQKISGGRCGRGLVATQVIQPGQLISATKAFEIIFLPNPKAAFSVNSAPNIQFLSSPTSAHRRLLQRIVQKLTLEPSLCRTFYQLHAGPDFQMFDDGKDPLVVDLKRIDAIIRYNTLEGSTSFKISGCTGSLQKSIGIWILPSFINHCCWDVNATWMTFGDMLFVRALKEIPIGGEILISYVDPTQLYQGREKVLNTFGFVCECRLCQIDRDHSKEGQKRMELLKKIQENRLSHNSGLAYQLKMDVMMDELWDLEDKYGQKLNLKLNPSLNYPLLESGLFYSNIHLQNKKCVKLFTKRYALSTNSAFKQMAVESCFRLIIIHLKDGNVEEANGWVETVKKELMTLYGTLDLAKLMMDRKALDLMEKYNIFLE